MSEDRSVTDLVTRARNGDKRAWEDFVRAIRAAGVVHLPQAPAERRRR